LTYSLLIAIFTANYFTLSKFLKILGRIVLAIILLLLIAYTLLHYSPVQTWLVKKVAADLSKKLNTEVQVGKVDFKFFNNISINDVLIKDLKKDTLLLAGNITGSVSSWSIKEEYVSIKNIRLENVLVNLNRQDSTWNYQFIIDHFDTGTKTKKPKSKSNFIIDLNEMHFTNVKFNQIDGWVGKDMIVDVRQLDLKVNDIDLAKKQINIASLNLNKPVFIQKDYDGKRPPKRSIVQIVDKIPILNALQWNSDGWNFLMKELTIKDGIFENDKGLIYAYETGRFDGRHLLFKNLNGSLKNISFIGDTLKAKLDINAKEQSGLQVKKLACNFKLTPAIMEFKGLDLITNKSKLGNYLSFEYKDFQDDFNSFIHNIIIKANFTNSNIHTDDLAFFAPALKTWKRDVKIINGNANGTVDDFEATNLELITGGSIFNGDLSMRGLPDINTTFINVKSKNLQTNNSELKQFVPSLVNLKKPDLNKLGNINFEGNFTGFINDFVTAGKFNTAQGEIIADINMKLPLGKTAIYKGRIASNGFNIGNLLNNKNFGNLALDLNINGSGFTLNELKENVVGKISSIKLGNYTYQNIAVDGDFEKYLFMGNLNINDPNLVVTNFNGAIDFSKTKPGFKLETNIAKADFKKLGFVKDDFLFSGNIDANFTGDNIDNFLGSAIINNATLYQGNNKLSFDYLNLNSEIIAGEKSLTLRTNELDANITGKFNVAQLPNAVTYLLAKYYPTYIKAPKYLVKSTQNFTYNIQTKNVEDYVKLLDKKLTGFNNSNIAGSFNLQAYDLQLTASIPQFIYDKQKFNNINISAQGNGEELLTNITAEEIEISDSLSLPKTTLKVATKNDVSVINLQTSASKIFGDAELNASITSLSDGIKINFAPSSFIINNKKWQLDKDGELLLSRKLFNASEVKFFSGNQEIILGTELSSENDDTYLTAKLKNINTTDFAFVLPKNPKLSTTVTGELKVYNVLQKPKFIFNGIADSATVNGEYVGKIDLDANINTLTGDYIVKGKSNEKKYDFNAIAKGNFKDTSGNGFNLKVNTRNVNLAILKPYISSIFSDIQGFANGDMEIGNKAGKMFILGNPIINNGAITVAYTQVKYLLDNKSILFGKNSIILNDIDITDTMGHIGKIDGRIYHEFFDNFSFKNLSFSSNKMLVLNTTKKDNQQFYGRVIGSAKMSLNGDIANMRMNIEGEPSPNEDSHVFLNTGESKENTAIDYIDFIQFGTVMENDLSSKGQSNLLIDLKLIANPSCKVDVILDETTGDVVRGAGNGELNIKLGNNEAMSMRGKYEIAQGEYTFNFQELIRKPFTVEKGGTITWNGDPLEALLDMKAEYQVKNVDISEYTGNSGTRLQEDIIIKSHLTGNLKKPNFSFELQLPENSSSRNNYYITKRLAQFKADENEMNKQVASLLLLGQFISNNQNQAFLTGGSIPTLVGGTLGGLVSTWLSGLLNNQLQKATKGVVSFAVDLNPAINSQLANQLQANIRGNLKFRILKNLRLQVGGNFDYNNPIAQLYGNANRITPDISLEFLVNKDGSLRLIAANRSVIDAASGQRNNTSLKLGYKKDIDRIGDIFRSKARIAELDSALNAIPPKPIKDTVTP
jgi:hypothetical protein